jgi:cyanate permease
LTIILASLGPLLVGWSFDIYESYRGAFFFLVVGYCFGAVMILNSPRPRPIHV